MNNPNRYKRFSRSSLGASTKHDMDERVSVLDGYHTPRVAVLELLAHEAILDYVWEPANGFSRISRVLAEHGLRVFTSDIHRWHGSTMVQRAFEDFADLPRPFHNYGCDVITNPPFSKAQMFIEHALHLMHDGNKLCLLLRLQFLESRKRKLLFTRCPPVRVLVFSYRLPRMHRFLWRGKRGGSTVCFAWFIFIKGYKGPTTLKWI